MVRQNNFGTPLSPPPTPFIHTGSSNNHPHQQLNITPGILITLLVVSIAVILSASFYLLLRLLRRHNHHQTAPFSPPPPPTTKNSLVDSLPIFPYSALTTTPADCAVCLSSFEPTDVLRLLPLCYHAFHLQCIDTWLTATPTCPLCRRSPFHHSFSSASFRLHLGTVSLSSSSSPSSLSYSLGGSFHYVINDHDGVISDIPSESLHRTEEVKVESTAEDVDHAAELAAGVGSRGGWLKEFLSTSVSSSFRGSGRWFFTGSSRRSTTELRDSVVDAEASRLSEEISELFRWLSGV